jgi:CheY-like chemotaxis protein
MPTKRALIVDDSRTAQFKLQKTLEVYDLSIDTVLSAEDALSYLSYQIPDVIFMDHSMKGMSGLEAVRIIKSNVATATIPVVMYTAQSGEVYLSQARAIGAIDVLSKDVMTESDIQRVMSGLKISILKPPVKNAKPSTKSANSVPQKNQFELIQIRDQVAKSLDIQQGQIRRELQDNTRVLINRFMREIRDLRQEIERQKLLDRELLSATIENQSDSPSYGIKQLWSCLFGALCIGLAWALWNNGDARQKHEHLLATNALLSAKIEEQQKFALQSKRQLSKIRSGVGSAQSKKLLRALTWAINQTGQFDFSETALADSRMNSMMGLVAELSEVNYAGTLTLDIHNGDFCVITNENGELSLPNQPIPISSCDFLSNSSLSFDQASQTSMDFMNSLQSFPIVENGDLKVDVQAHGLSKPFARYPDIEQITTSDQWNRVALANNRLNISLSN